MLHSDSARNLWIRHLPSDKICKLDLGIEFKKTNHDCCVISPKAKQTKLSFNLSSSTTTQPFELVHIDTCGPYHTPTFKYCRYLLTLVNDYSRTTWTHLLSTESSAFPMIKAFVDMVKTQFSTVFNIS